MCRTSLSWQNYLAPNIKNAEAEKLWSNWFWTQGSKPGRAVSEYMSKCGVRNARPDKCPQAASVSNITRCPAWGVPAWGFCLINGLRVTAHLFGHQIAQGVCSTVWPLGGDLGMTFPKEIMKIMVTSFKRCHARTALRSAPNPAAGHADPSLCQGLQDNYGKIGTSLVCSHCSFLLSPGVHKVLFVSSKSLFPQSCVSSDGSMVGLMVTSSKRAYAIPRYTAPRTSAPAVVHWSPIPLQETLKHSSVSVSVGSLGPGAHKVCLSLLSISGGYGVWF